MRSLLPWFAAAVVALGSLAAAEQAAPAPTPGWRFEELRRYAAPEAGQGVVAGEEDFFAINNHTVARYAKADGRQLALWEGGAGGAIIHLNAGILFAGRLHCAHSNFPGVPMISSVEVFDPASLRHVASHSFGRTDGSLTWIDRRNGRWIACFVHYGRRGGEPGRGPEWTQLVEFDDDWRRTGGWSFPPALITRLAERGFSASGGAIGPGGYLYVMGHDHPELYVLEFPTAGGVLKWIATVPVPAEGQAFGWDPHEPDLLYLSSRPTREVIVGRLHRP